MNKIDHAVDKALEELKGKCIDAVEDNFNLYLLNDLSDVGEVSELFDKEDWLEIMMNETTPFRRKLTHCFGAN